ncbi:MAG: filamentous hemagglutinin N-terminal domain-containing protein, partial [Alphaproteobacteria bacterium]|nr:filamentous hemagglutinin N-terminal domain-containing protein [Alphaproteobacteria bacterium]
CGVVARLVLAWVMVLAQTLPLYANPIDGTVSAGDATISSAGNTLTVTQASDKAVIDWRGFDIAHGETTNFVQPNASSMTLNRVNSATPSFIDGNLTANGNLIVVNPNGVWFGAGARVDVNSLIATTAGISNDAFMNSTGTLNFDQPGNPNAAIVNDGMITAKEAGLVGLVAPNVVNNGVILAKLGRVHLASGDTATVDLYGDGLMDVAVSDAVTSQLVANNGIIAAQGGTIAMTAAAGSNIVNSLVKVSGELHAPSISQHNGKIIIAAEGSNAVKHNIAANKGKKSGTSTVIVDGVINASGRHAGERGGSVQITADNIALLDGTVIDASGSDGLSGTTFNQAVSAYRDGSAGGDIRIGGDYLGGGDTATAKNLYVDKGVLVLNDALNSGDAGRSIFWSDDTTSFYGNVYARALGGKPVDTQTWNATAGGNTGDGGFIETSGHGHLNAGGYVDLTASNGARGTYFLDPTDITIYGNFAPNFATVVQGDATTLASNLKLWLDA